MKFLQSFLYSQLDSNPVASKHVANWIQIQLATSHFRFETALRNLDHFGYVIRFERINFWELDSGIRFWNQILGRFLGVRFWKPNLENPRGCVPVRAPLLGDRHSLRPAGGGLDQRSGIVCIRDSR